MPAATLAHPKLAEMAAMPIASAGAESGSVLLIADDDTLGRAEIDAAGARCLAAVPLRAGTARLDQTVAVDVVLVEIAADVALEHGAAALDALFGRLWEGADEHRFRSIVIVPPAMIDHAAAMLDHPGIALLVAPAPADRARALADALAASRMPEALRVADGGTDSAAVRLNQIRAEVAQVASRLAAIAGSDLERRGVSDSGDVASGGGEAAVDAGLIRAIIRARRQRARFFRDELFADPAWDMLLDLTAARLEGVDVAVSSLCIAAAVPPTTALRWIKILSDEGLLVRRADPGDRRRVFIALADAAASGMMDYLAEAQRIGAAVM